MSGGGEDQLVNQQTSGIGDQEQTPNRDMATSDPAQNGRTEKVW